MAQLGIYTTTEAVRACLGLDLNDCDDSVMLDSLLDIELNVNLNSWLPAHATLFAAGGLTGATDPQKYTRSLIILFAQWWCAKEIAARRLLVPQVNTDGKASLSRFKIDLIEAESKAASRAAAYQNALVEDQGSTPVTVGSLSLVLAAQPSVDPITASIQ